MNTRLLLIALFCPLPLLAEPKPENAPPPPAEANQPGWLGVSAVELGEQLRLHLGIDHGVVLQTVLPGSPAEKAGLAVHDIITEVGDDAVGSMDDLRTAIQGHQGGDEVGLKVIQKGRPVDKKVALADRPGPQMEPGVRIIPMGPNGKAQLRLQLNNLQLQGGGNLELGVGAMGASVKMRDAGGSVEMQTKDDAREVIVRDHFGEIQFEGPWDTPQDKASAPPEVRARIEAVSGMFGDGEGMLQMNVIPAPAEDDPKPKDAPKVDE